MPVGCVVIRLPEFEQIKMKVILNWRVLCDIALIRAGLSVSIPSPYSVSV